MTRSPQVDRWLAVLAIVSCVLLVVFRFSDLDLRISGYFYDGAWVDASTSWIYVAYHYAPAAIIILFVAAVFSLRKAFGGLYRRSMRRDALYLFLVLLIGPGLVVNVGFKSNWCRPRPVQVAEFGGFAEFVPLGSACKKSVMFGKDRIGNSFPSGHSSIGFALLALYFPWRRRLGLKATWVIAAGIATGCWIGLARIAVGGHFASDVLTSGVIVALTSTLSWWFVNLTKPEQDTG